MSHIDHINEEGAPCKHMEPLLQSTADGTSKGLGRWYALAHSARCGQCGRFLHRLEETLQKLRDSRAKADIPVDALARLKSGAWREVD